MTLQQLFPLASDHLDLQCLCSLSQTSQFFRTVSEPLFKHKLQLVCPWFEPQFSFRESWKECAFEYVRRQSGNITLPPAWKVVQDKYDDSDMPEEREQLEMKDLTHVFTSEYGIEVKTAALKGDIVVMSLPNVCILAGFEDTECTVVVKFKDSADSTTTLKMTEVPQFYAQGTHVFLSSYLDNTERLDYVTKKGLVKIALPPVTDMEGGGIVCYDGLFHWYRDKKLYFIQAGFEEPVWTTRSELPINTYFISTCSTWTKPYMATVVTHEMDVYWLDVKTGCLSKCYDDKKDGPCEYDPVEDEDDDSENED